LKKKPKRRGNQAPPPTPEKSKNIARSIYFTAEELAEVNRGLDDPEVKRRLKQANIRPFIASASKELLLRSIRGDIQL